MTNKAVRILLFFLGFTLTTYAQPAPKKEAGTDADTTLVNTLIQQSKEQAAADPAKAILLATQAKEFSEKINYIKGQAYSLKHIGLGYYNLGKYVEALNYWDQSLKVFEQLKDDIGVANMLNNIAIIYIGRGDDDKGLEYSLRSLKLSEKTGDKLRILSALNTIGSIYYNKKATRTIDSIRRTLGTKQLTIFYETFRYAKRSEIMKRKGPFPQISGKSILKKRNMIVQEFIIENPLIQKGMLLIALLHTTDSEKYI